MTGRVCLSWVESSALQKMKPQFQLGAPRLRCQTKQGLTKGINEQSCCSVSPVAFHQVNVPVKDNELGSMVCGWQVERF